MQTDTKHPASTPSRCDSPLVRAPNLNVCLRSARDVVVKTSTGSANGGPLGLTILDVFARPTTIGAALKELKPRIKGIQAWMDVTGVIQRFRRAGVLLDARRTKFRLHTESHEFDAPGVHTAMLNDRARTDGLLRAIRSVVRPEDVVLDIGAGTGVLAVAAAQAGARHVYAVEAGDIANVAEAVIGANGLSHRITLLRGLSTQIDLPVRADVLVSEIIGAEPLGERVIETFSDARRRLLKPAARMIPHRLRIMGLPVEMPRETVNQRTFTPESLDNWRKWYGIDFSPLAEYGRASSHRFTIKPDRVRKWKSISRAVVLADLDLGGIERRAVDCTVTAKAQRGGELNGVLVYFEADLGAGHLLSTDPDRSDSTNHWASHMWVVGNPLRLDAGDRFDLTYRYGVAGQGNGVSAAAVSPGEDANPSEPKPREDVDAAAA